MAARCTPKRLQEIREQIERLETTPREDVFGYEIRSKGLRALEAQMAEACELVAA